ncbi:MAG: periplasmic heavy metal sensor [Chloroflexia bacterium]
MKNHATLSTLALVTISLSLATLIVSGCTGSSGTSITPPSGTGTGTGTPAQPYAGLQDRGVKALSAERVADLLAGRGATYAQAADLNHYPGPRHVLDLKTQLKLTPEQENEARNLYQAMEKDARSLGQQILDAETELDREFSAGSITSEKLSELTARIHELDGELRQVHLSAHIGTRAALNPDQIAMYDQLRGYTTNPGAGQETPSSHTMPHSGTTESSPTPQP